VRFSYKPKSAGCLPKIGSKRGGFLPGTLSVLLLLLHCGSSEASDRGVYLKFNLWREGYVPSLSYIENQPWGKFTFDYKPFRGFRIKTRILNSINFSYKSSQGFKFSVKPKLLKDIEAGYRRYRENLLSSLSTTFGKEKRKKPYLVYCERNATGGDCPLKVFLFKEGDFLFVNPDRPLKAFTVYVKGQPCPSTELLLIRADDPFGKPFLEIYYGGEGPTVKIKIGSSALSVVVPDGYGYPKRKLSFGVYYNGKTVGGFVNDTNFTLEVPAKLKNTAVGDFYILSVKRGCFYVETLAVYPKMLSTQELFILRGLNF